MEYRSLGRTGVMVSPLCLGAMNFGGPTDESASIEIINKALDAGINFIDTANVYNAGESERIVGKALKKNGKRDDILLSRDENGTLKITHIDLTDSAFMASEYFYIKPNDVIIVNPNDRAVNSSGLVDIGTLLSIASLALSVTILLTR